MTTAGHVLEVGEEPCELVRPRPTPAAKKKKNAAGRFHVLNGFVDFTMWDLSRAEITVWFVLFRDTKSDGTARTGQADISRRIGMCERTVGRALRRLKERGLVEVVRRGRLGGGPSSYRVRAMSLEIA